MTNSELCGGDQQYQNSIGNFGMRNQTFLKNLLAKIASFHQPLSQMTLRVLVFLCMYKVHFLLYFPSHGSFGKT